MFNPTKAKVSIQVRLSLEQSPSGEAPPPAVVYAFTDSGHFVARAEADAHGSATLSIPSAASARNVRLVVGPELPGEDQPALSELSRRGAHQQLARLEAGAEAASAIFEVPPESWLCWVRRCRVNGTLLKSVVSGGLPLHLPVRNALIHIWAVEPLELVLGKVPVGIIEKIRDTILYPVTIPGNPNPPDPGPLRGLAARSVQVRYAPPVPTVARSGAAELLNLQVVAQTADSEAFRQALIANIGDIRPRICEFIWIYVTKTLLGTTTTDQCGNFSKSIFAGCAFPNLNLYFTATSGPHTIYDPTPISCHTYWNYQCGTHVTLNTDSQFAQAGAPCAPVQAGHNYVLFRAIGNTPLSQIYGASPLLKAATTAANLGLVAAAPGEDAPFGGNLLPRVEFDSSLLEQGLASHYRISYQSPTSGGWQPLTGDIHRHYDQFVGTKLVTTVYPLGPKTVGAATNLFAIPPALPPAGDWSYPDPPYDLANAQVPTAALPGAVAGGTSGLYQLKLDLFDAAGHPVDIKAAGITYYVPSTVEADGTIDAVDASTLPGLVVGNSLIINIFVDNRPTAARLPAVLLGSGHADQCGMLVYTDPGQTVDIEYVAAQPGNFLDWSLAVYRGLTGQVAATSNNTSAGSFATPAEFDNKAADLLGSCAGAAFAVNLYCASRTTDGWSRQVQYDTSASISFALITPCAG